MVAASKKAAAIALIAAHSAKRNLELGSFSFIGERDGKVVAELSNGKLFELFTIESIRGKDGRDGMSIAGRDGKHGRGIETITQPNDSQLDIELTDGQRLRFALPKGEKGDPGRDGKDGIAGPRGERGPIGAAGRDGIGIQGEKGQKGDTGPAPDHEWRGTELRFRNPDGSWGKWVDLKGQPGRDGKKGFVLNGSIANSVLPELPNTGWAQYLDTEFTEAAPFVLSDGVTSTLPNNAGNNITNYLPEGVTLYNPLTQKLTPGAVGDYNAITIRFNAETSSTSTYLEFGIDTGNPAGPIFADIKVFPKGAGVKHPFTFTCLGFSLNNFFGNGGIVKLTALGGDVEVYDINYHFARLLPV